jgi:hypothetical protein
MRFALGGNLEYFPVRLPTLWLIGITVTGCSGLSELLDEMLSLRLNPSEGISLEDPNLLASTGLLEAEPPKKEFRSLATF